jgi:hypothetical protein
MTPSSPDPPNPGIPAQLVSAQVLARFVMRMIILALFATVGRQGFSQTLQGLLTLAALYCCLAATFRRETLFSDTLTHFDEAAAYGVIAGAERLFA